MVSASVCFGGKGRLHFVDESAKVDSAYTTLAVSYTLLPSLVDDCTRLLPSGYTSSSTHSSCYAELAPNQLPILHCQRPVASEFIRLEPLKCLGKCWMPITTSQAPSETENYRRTEGSPAGDLGQPTSLTNRQSCQRVVKEFSKRLKACVAADGRHFEHSQ